MANPFPAGRPQASKLRWLICALLFFSTTVNYLDRQVISYLKEYFCMPLAQGGFGWSNAEFSYLTSAFTAFYAGVTIFAGWFIDRIGTKLGLALALIVWSTFGVLNAFVGRTLMAHILIRSAFGIGEGGNFPASIKTVAEWFPKRERALATGIFNSGTNVGAMIAALFVPWCLAHFGYASGWKLSFIITGALGFIWLFFWFRTYEAPANHPGLSQAEFDLIHADDDPVQLREGALPSRMSWIRLVGYRQTWAFFVGKFLTDGVWWFYLFWLPDYLHKQFGMTKQQVMIPTFIVYGVAIFGSIYGGRVPMKLIQRGMPVYRARMLAMAILAIFPLAVLLTQYLGDVHRFGPVWAPVGAVAMISIGAAAHQAWSANLFTTVSDMFPKKAVGSVTGIGAMAGGVGGVVVQLVAGRLTDHFAATPSVAYLFMFMLCAFSYLIAWTLMKALVPRHEPITDL